MSKNLDLPNSQRVEGEKAKSLVEIPSVVKFKLWKDHLPHVPQCWRCNGPLKNKSWQMPTPKPYMSSSMDLRIQESKTIREFYAKLCYLSNQVFALGEEYSDAKLVRKVLRYLFERFSIKTETHDTTLARDVSTESIKLPQEPITRSRAKNFKDALASYVDRVWDEQEAESI
ncbi:hypothetical protein Gotur_032890, partial [Gossypium turneri]